MHKCRTCFLADSGFRVQQRMAEDRHGCANLAVCKVASGCGPKHTILQLLPPYLWGSGKCMVHFVPPPCLNTGLQFIYMPHEWPVHLSATSAHCRAVVSIILSVELCQTRQVEGLGS